MSMAGRMSRTGPELKSKGGPGPCTTPPGPVTGITSSPAHPQPLTPWPAWHCALAHWRAQTGCCEAGTGSSGGGGLGGGRQEEQGRQHCTPSRPPTTPPTNRPQLSLYLHPKPGLGDLQGLTVSPNFDRSAFPSILAKGGWWVAGPGGELPAVTPAGSFYNPFAIEHTNTSASNKKYKYYFGVK